MSSTDELSTEWRISERHWVETSAKCELSKPRMMHGTFRMQNCCLNWYAPFSARTVGLRSPQLLIGSFAELLACHDEPSFCGYTVSIGRSWSLQQLRNLWWTSFNPSPRSSWNLSEANWVDWNSSWIYLLWFPPWPIIMGAKALPSSLAVFARSFSIPSRMSLTALLMCNVCDVKESPSSWSLILFNRLMATGAYMRQHFNKLHCRLCIARDLGS